MRVRFPDLVGLSGVALAILAVVYAYISWA